MLEIDRKQFEALLRIYEQSSQNATEDNEALPTRNVRPKISERNRRRIMGAMQKAHAQRQIIKDGIDRYALLQVSLSPHCLKQSNKDGPSIEMLQRLLICLCSVIKVLKYNAGFDKLPKLEAD